MNRDRTVFFVAVLGVVFLGAATLMAIYAQTYEGAPSDVTFALITGLVGIVSAAGAYLFAKNGDKGAP